MAETLALPFLDSGALNIDPDDATTLRNLTIEGGYQRMQMVLLTVPPRWLIRHSRSISTTLTQFGADFSVGSIAQDGYSTGQLRGVEIDATGVLFTRYTNGQTRQQSQIALANFTNPNGLQPVGDTSVCRNVFPRVRRRSQRLDFLVRVHCSLGRS